MSKSKVELLSKEPPKIAHAFKTATSKSIKNTLHEENHFHRIV